MSPEPPGLRAQVSPTKGTGGSGDESAPPLVSRFAQNAAFASLGPYPEYACFEALFLLVCVIKW